MYADDIQIYLECENVDSMMSLLNSCFREIILWAELNYLKLNNAKTKLLFVTNKCNLHKEILFNNESNFKLESLVKNLGFSIDSSLNLDKQINQVCKRGYYLLHNLWRISSKLTDIKLKIQIIKSCLLCHIDYCNSLYISLPQNKINKLQRLMNAGIRFIYNLRISDDYSITELMKQCHFLPVNARIEFKICVLVYKCLTNQAPSYLQQLLYPKHSLESLRVHSDTSLLYRPKLDSRNYKNRRFSVIGPQIWNKLPLEIRTVHR